MCINAAGVFIAFCSPTASAVKCKEENITYITAAFCVITVALGIISDWLYEKSGCIWIPALFHGAFNAVGTLPLMITVPDTGTARLLGSAPVGLLAGLPIVIFAVVLLLKCKKNAE